MAMAWLPMKYLVSHVIPDDAFYYFQTARNIVNGRGVSFDGEVWANGFHPLWLLMLLPVYGIVRGDPETPIHVSLTLSALAVSGSGPVLYLTARRIGLDALPSAVVTGFYLFYPIIMLMSVNGLETGLNLALFVVTLYSFVRANQKPSLTAYMVVSACGGLLVLSRTDYGIVVAVMMMLWLLWRRRAERPVASMMALAIPALVCTLPWFAWRQATFGSPVQVSGGAVPYVAHQQSHEPDASLVDDVLEGLRRVPEAMIETIPSFYLGPSLEMAWVGALLFATLVLTALLLPHGDARWGGYRVAILGVPLAGLLLQLVVHAGIRWYVREWYFLPILVIVALLVGHVMQELRGSRVGQIASLALMGIFVALILPKGVRNYVQGLYPWQHNMLAAARWVGANTSFETRLGSFNSGIVGYFSGGPRLTLTVS